MNEHLSSEQIANLLLDEKDQPARWHLRECETCRTEVDRLRNAISLYRDAARNWSDHWITAYPVPSQSARSRNVRSWGVVSVMSAIILAVVLLVVSTQPNQQVDEPFVSIPYVVPATPAERTRVMRMDVPAAALRSAGLAFPLREAGALVPADVLVGQDGRPLAVRLIDRRFDQ